MTPAQSSVPLSINLLKHIWVTIKLSQVTKYTGYLRKKKEREKKEKSMDWPKGRRKKPPHKAAAKERKGGRKRSVRRQQARKNSPAPGKI